MSSIWDRSRKGRRALAKKAARALWSSRPDRKSLKTGRHGRAVERDPKAPERAIVPASELRAQTCPRCGGAERLDTDALRDYRLALARLVCVACNRDRWVAVLERQEPSRSFAEFQHKQNLGLDHQRRFAALLAERGID